MRPHWTAPGVRRLGLSAAAFSLVVVACGGSAGTGIEYKDPDDRALFVIPDDWHLYTADDLVGLATTPFTTQFEDNFPVAEQVAFDGAPGRDVANVSVSVANAGYPVGAYTVRSVSAADRDLVSRGAMQSMVLGAQDFVVGEAVLTEDFGFGSGFDGIRRLLPFTEPGSSQEGVVYFIAVANPEATLVYTMAVGCSTGCWDANQEDIVKAVDSWIVNTRQ